MWDGTHDMGWWMAAWMVLGGVVWVILAALLASIMTGAWNRRDGRQQHESPLEVARRRYASGEITSDEFDAIRRNLA